MSRAGRTMPWLGASAALALLAGAAAAAWSLHAIGRAAPRLRAKAADVQALRRLAAERAGDRAHQAAFDALPSHRPRDVAEYTAAHLPNERVERGPEERLTVAGGWTLCRRTITFREVALPKLMEWIAAAEGETNRPPWRLRACTIRAAGPSAAYGDATLTLEALERAD